MKDEHGKAYERNVDPRSNLPKTFGRNSNKLKNIDIIMELKIVLHVNGYMTWLGIDVDLGDRGACLIPRYPGCKL